MQSLRVGLVVVLCVFWAGVGWAAQKDKKTFAPVPQTGQTICYDITGAERDCAGTGEDGELQKGVELPTPRFKDNGDGTIKDNLTRLIWLKNANCIVDNPGFDQDGPDDGAVNWQHALDFVADINDGTYNCGDTSGKRGSHQTDWRLPNLRELFSLVDFAFSIPALSNADGDAQCTVGDCPFSGFLSVFYWSSTTDNDTPPGFAWNVWFLNGSVVTNLKTTNRYVLAVRGGL